MDALALATAAALLVVGVAAVVLRQWAPATAALVASACLPAVAGTDAVDVSPPTLAVAALATPLLAPLVAWCCLPRRPALTVALTAGVLAGPLRSLGYDPFHDPTCVTDCVVNPLAVVHLDPGVTSALLALAAVAALALTWAAATGPHRIPLAVLAAAAWAVVPSGPRPPASVAAGAVGLVLVGVEVTRAFETRARVVDLARALRAAADVEVALREATGDPRVAVAYWRDDEQRFDRPDGTPVTEVPQGLARLDIHGPSGPVARVLHDPRVATGAMLARAVAGPARLALDNGRLTATVRRQADSLAASRRRIVADADGERRRLERDLHDGAQQHVLALGLELRRGLDDADDPDDRAVLAAALASTHQVLHELRELSHGFYPSSLEQTGLRNALDGVADRSPVPLAVRALPARRFPDPVERAVYLLVSRVAAAGRRPLEVSVESSPTRVHVTVLGGVLPDEVLSDVYAVLGGSVWVTGDDAPAVHAHLPLDRDAVVPA